MTTEELAQVIKKNRLKLVRYAHVELRRRNRQAEDAEDVVQQAMVDLTKTYDRIDLDGSATIWTIMCQKVLDEVKDYHRKIRRREEHAPHVSLDDPIYQHISLGLMPAMETVIDVTNAFKRLPPDEAELVFRVKMEGRPYLEVGQTLGLSKNQAQGRYEEGLKFLRDALAVYAPDHWDPAQAQAA